MLNVSMVPESDLVERYFCDCVAMANARFPQPFFIISTSDLETVYHSVCT
jgi:hypothetical protein